MLPILTVLSSGSGFDFSNSNSNYDNRNSNVSSHLCTIIRSINLAHMAKNNTFSRALVTKVKTIF
jgi:hypothetical protein